MAAPRLSTWGVRERICFTRRRVFGIIDPDRLPLPLPLPLFLVLGWAFLFAGVWEFRRVGESVALLGRAKVGNTYDGKEKRIYSSIENVRAIQ